MIDLFCVPVKAQRAGDIVREHRHGTAPTYGDLLGGERFNPEDALQLTYTQTLNLENYLYLAIATFGLITVVLASGVLMIVTGPALGLTGFVLLEVSGNVRYLSVFLRYVRLCNCR